MFGTAALKVANEVRSYGKSRRYNGAGCPSEVTNTARPSALKPTASSCEPGGPMISSGARWNASIQLEQVEAAVGDDRSLPAIGRDVHAGGLGHPQAAAGIGQDVPPRGRPERRDFAEELGFHLLLPQRQVQRDAVEARRLVALAQDQQHAAGRIVGQGLGVPGAVGISDAQAMLHGGGLPGVGRGRLGQEIQADLPARGMVVADVADHQQGPVHARHAGDVLPVAVGCRDGQDAKIAARGVA